MPARFIGNIDHALSRLRSSRQDPILPGYLPSTTPSRAENPSQRYASGDVVFAKQSVPNSFTSKLAQSQTIFTQPQFYSPLHTPQNWQIPSKRREIYNWCRYFFENEAKVAAAINFYSQFPLSGGFELQCEDPKIKRFFEHLCKKLKVDEWCRGIAQEYFLIGDVFPFLEIECERCRGAMVVNGKTCDHAGGTFRRLVTLNPDWVDVQKNIFADDPLITLLPDEELRRVVFQKQPKPIYEKIPDHVKKLILAGRPFPLDDMSVSHLRFNPHPYGTYGTSLIRRLFKILAYKDKLMTAQWLVAERLILPVRIVKVGEKERPAGPADIAAVQQQIAQVANDPNLTLVTHHAFEYDWVGTSGKILQLSNEHELINKEILQGLMLNEALLSGDMPGYSSAAIGAEAIIQRLEDWRRELAQWIENHVFKPVAMMKGFIDEDQTKELGELVGEPLFIVPKVKWAELHLRDQQQANQTLLSLQERGLVSAQTTLEKLDYDYDQEVERIRYETAEQSLGQAAAGGMGGGGMGGMGGMDMGGGLGGPPGGGLGGAPESVLPGGEVGGPAGAPGAPPAPGGPGAGAGTTGKIMKPGKSKNVPKEEEVQPSHVRLTSLEQKMYKTIMGMRLPFKAFSQYPLGPYRTDFAIPQIRLAIECDGEYWHKQPEAVAKDMKRDSELAASGWTVVRFAERDINERMPDIQYSISSLINELWSKAYKRQKETNAAMEKRDIKMASDGGQVTGIIVTREDMEDSHLRERSKMDLYPKEKKLDGDAY